MCSEFPYEFIIQGEKMENTPNNRVKQIRKKLNLSQKQFGEKIGLKANSISDIENEKNALTNQNIKLICSVFNISYDWLLYGTGEMQGDTFDDVLTRIDHIMTGENETAKRLFSAFSRLNNEEWKTLEKLIDFYLEEKEKN